jgi:uncharacterized protein YutE (UPF0331/DUF86 family)
VVDRQKLSTRLDALDGYLLELRSFQGAGREEFVREGALHHLAERYLELACACVLDIAQHVIADQGYRQALTYKDAIDVLREEGLLAPDLAERLRRWMGLRNLLVHLYLEIDHGEVYQFLQNDLGDLDEFARAMSRFLE